MSGAKTRVNMWTLAHFYYVDKGKYCCVFITLVFIIAVFALVRAVSKSGLYCSADKFFLNVDKNSIKQFGMLWKLHDLGL